MAHEKHARLGTTKCMRKKNLPGLQFPSRVVILL